MESGLTERCFVLQDQRPGDLDEIELLAVDPALRALLFTDGTVTRTLEAQTLSPVSVEVTAQATCTTPEPIATHLHTPVDSEAIRRRVTIGLDSTALPAIWAESYLMPDRLPEGFLRLLDDTPDGIGESLQQVRLEGWREMMWFGIDSPPAWDHTAPHAASVFLTRLYRVITKGRPALLIAESFAIERREGLFHLSLEASPPQAVPNSSSISAMTSSSEAESRS